ncbi:hypothetical protein [Cloacibacillus sp.]
MYKIKREIIRLWMQMAVKYPNLIPAIFSKYIKMMWNDNQRRCAEKEYRTVNFDVKADDLKKDTQILDLSCTSGFGETVHPDVLFIPGGFGEFGWKYVMTLTPLPRGIEYFENPEFLVSHDGISWEIPCGGKSPLVDAPFDWVGYNSDPTLFYEDGIVHMIYRRTEYKGNGADVRLLVMHSSDGVCWSVPLVIMEEHYHRKDLAVLMSPTVVKLAGEYLMWYVQGSGGSFSVVRAQSKDLYQWYGFMSSMLRGMPEGTEPWHLDVIKKGKEELLMALCYQHVGNYKSNRGILFASSNDGGILWNISGKHLEPGESNFCKKSLYKASAVFAENGGLLLYYSGQDNLDHWLTVRREITL